MFRRFKVREHERGLLFRDRVFQDVLGPGVHLFFDPLFKLNVRDRAGARAVALARRPGRDRALGGAAPRGAGPGPEVPRAGRRLGRRPSRGRAEAGSLRAVDGLPRRRRRSFDARAVRSSSTSTLRRSWGLPGSAPQLEAVTIEAGHAGLFFKNGRHEATLAPGLYALWKGVARPRSGRRPARAGRPTSPGRRS